MIQGLQFTILQYWAGAIMRFLKLNLRKSIKKQTKNRFAMQTLAARHYIITSRLSAQCCVKITTLLSSGLEFKHYHLINPVSDTNPYMQTTN